MGGMASFDIITVTAREPAQLATMFFYKLSRFLATFSWVFPPHQQPAVKTRVMKMTVSVASQDQKRFFVF